MPNFIYAVEIDKCMADVCVGMGLFFTDARSEREARKLGEKRCREEREYREEAVWKVVSVIKLRSTMSLDEFLEKYRDHWFILKQNGGVTN